MISLQATKKTESNEALREKGLLPAVVYGMGKDPVSISLETKLFIKAWHEAGESTTVTLELDGEKITTLIHDLQKDVVRGTPIHADFLRIDTNKPISVNVPIILDGVSPAVKGSLGVLIHSLHEVEIEALPKDLPHDLHVDIGGLNAVDSHITVANIIVPKGVTVLTPGTEIVASITAQVEEKEEAPVDISAIGISVEKGKEEAEGEAAPESDSKGE